MLKRILKPPKRSFFLFGIRGSGKSTWGKDALPNAYHLDLLDETLYLQLLSEPGSFRERILAECTSDWVIVDEVQRIPNLLNEVQSLMGSHKLKFALLTSSVRQLKTQSTNLLRGRASQRFMYPFAPQELGSEFDLEQTLQFGSIPVVCEAEDRANALRSYVNLYLREEIRMEALVRNLPGFARFLPIAALFHAQSLNVRAVARDAQVAESTVKGFIEVIEDTLIASRLRGYESRLRVKERKHPKLYFVDPGLVRTLKNQFGPLAVEERGALFEGWVYALLVNYQHTNQLFEQIHYWAPHNTNLEVDFLLQRGSSLIALEVKSTRTYNTQLLKGLRAIHALPGLTRRILLYNGNTAFQTEDGIEIWPVNRFLQVLADDQLWL